MGTIRVCLLVDVEYSFDGDFGDVEVFKACIQQDLEDLGYCLNGINIADTEDE